MPRAETVEDTLVLGRVGELWAGTYRLDRLIAATTAGELYEASHTANRHKVALRLLDSQLVLGPEAAARLSHSAQAIAQHGGASLARYTVATAQPDPYRAQPTPFLVYELPVTPTLDALLAARATLTLDIASAIIAQLTQAIAPLHSAGWAHGDLHPAAVVMGGGRRLKLRILDFAVLTAPGPASPGYTAPERIAGGPAEPRGDVFSVGAILYRCLTGLAAFPGDPKIAPLPLRSVAPSLPEEVEQIVHRALAWDPGQRHSTIAELCADFVRAAGLGHRPPREWGYSTKKVIVVGVVVAALTILQIALRLGH